MTFDEFLDRELSALIRYARVLTGDRHDAHDVLADALVAAQLRWKRIGKMDHPNAYVRRILTTTFLSGKRRWSARHVTLTPTGDLPEPVTPDESARVDDRDWLRDQLFGLPDRQRAAVVLRYYLDRTDQQIADELGCAQPTVRSLVSRALVALRMADTPQAAFPDEPSHKESP